MISYEYEYTAAYSVPVTTPSLLCPVCPVAYFQSITPQQRGHGMPNDTFSGLMLFFL